MVINHTDRAILVVKDRTEQLKMLLVIFLSFCLLLSSVSAAFTDSTVISAESHIQKGNEYLKAGHHFMAIDEYKQAVAKGLNDPEVFRNLSLVYYYLGLLEEAVTNMERAFILSPDSNFMRMDLGVICLAKNRLDDAKDQFLAALNKNPGLTVAYYYLGEIFYRKKDYDMAWMFVKMAQRLRHKGKDLEEKLKLVKVPPDVKPWSHLEENLFIRQILVASGDEANKIVDRISAGELFENIASREDKSLNPDLGGFMGQFKPPELNPKIAAVLSDSEVLSAPIIVETEAGFHIIQRIAPFNFDQWKKLLADSDITKVRKTNITQTSSNEKKKFFLVHVGSFRKEKSAVDLVKKLHELGYPGYSFVKNTPKGSLHRVVAGKYESLQKAKEAGKNIAGHGFKYYISQ